MGLVGRFVTSICLQRDADLFILSSWPCSPVGRKVHKWLKFRRHFCEGCGSNSYANSNISLLHSLKAHAGTEAVGLVSCTLTTRFALLTWTFWSLQLWSRSGAIYCSCHVIIFWCLPPPSASMIPSSFGFIYSFLAILCMNAKSLPTFVSKRLQHVLAAVSCFPPACSCPTPGFFHGIQCLFTGSHVFVGLSYIGQKEYTFLM